MVSTRKSFSSNIEETNLNKDYVENIISEDNSVIDTKNHLINQKTNTKNIPISVQGFEYKFKIFGEFI